MRVLLDTCVLSKLRRPGEHREVRRAVEQIADEDLFISVISMGEIIKGIELLNEGKRKKSLQDWVQALQRYYAKRILPVDVETVHIWGELTAKAQKQGKGIPALDGLIAATALRHGLHVMTRNVADFVPTGAMLINPWDGK